MWDACLRGFSVSYSNDHQWRPFIQTGEAAIVVAFVLAAAAFGADMLLVAACLVVALMVSAVGICTAPNLSVRSKLGTTAVAAIVLALIGGGLWTHANKEGVMPPALRQESATAATIAAPSSSQTPRLKPNLLHGESHGVHCL